jgi:hypothetical protein
MVTRRSTPFRQSVRFLDKARSSTRAVPRMAALARFLGHRESNGGGRPCAAAAQ